MQENGEDVKVLFVTAPGSLMTTGKAAWIRPMVRYLPCDLIECYSASDVRNHIGSADVVLLDNGPRFVPYWKDLTFLNGSSAFIGYYPLDPWYPRKLDDLIRSDVYLVSSPKVVKRHVPQIKHRLFCLPPSIDVQDYYPPRDIDVLFWGAVNYPSETSYPFRAFVTGKLKSSIVGKGKKVDPFLSIYDIDVAGCRYKYGFVKATPGMFSWSPNVKQLTYGYYGSRLYRLLSRARICVTGSKIDPGIPLGKFFENAVCGLLTMSNKFAEMGVLGFEHGRNIWITNKERFLDDLTYLLERPNLVEEMSKNAKELIRAKHTRTIRAQELYAFLCRETGKT